MNFFKVSLFWNWLNENDVYKRGRYHETGMAKKYLENCVKGGLTG